MSQAITLFLSPDGPPRWLHPSAGAGSGPLDQLPDRGRLPVRVVVPGQAVFVSAVALPGRSSRRQLQALPYAMEEQLVQEVDAYHFALGAALGGGRHLAAAVEHRTMSGWMATLEQAGIEPDSVVPATVALPEPASASHGVIAIVEERALVRVGPDRAYEADLADLDTLLALEQQLEEVQLLDPEDRWQAPASLRCAPLAVSGTLEQMQAQQVDKAPVNLLQGPYAGRREAGAKVARLWRGVAAVAAGVALLASVELLLQYRSTAALADQLEGMTDEAVGQALGGLPENYRADSARSLLEARLRALRGSGSGDGLLFLLETVGPRLVGGPGVRIQSMNYTDDGLILELTADRLDDIEALRQRIGSETGVAVALESASTMADGTGARLRIGGTAG